MDAPTSRESSQQLRKSESRVLLLLAPLGFLLAWFLTSPQLLLGINWDAASYVAGVATGRITWSTTPWNNHFAMGHLWFLFGRLGVLCGGTTVDGFRLCGALFFAVMSGVFAQTAFYLCRQRILAALLTLVFMTSWANTVLTMAHEWNVYFLAPASAILWLSLTRLSRWRWQDSVIAGLLGAGAALISWQAAPYLFPAGYAAFFGCYAHRSESDAATPEVKAAGWRGLVIRLRDVAIILAAFFAGLVSWSLLVAATSSQKAAALLHVQFSRPVPSALPHGLPDLGRLILNVPAQLRSTGIAAAFMLLHDFSFHLPRYIVPYWVFGAVTTLGVFALFALCTWRLIRQRDLRTHLLASTLLVLLLLTSLWHEFWKWEYATMKRFNFLPLLLWLILASLLRDARLERRGRTLLSVGLLLLGIFQFSQTVRFARRWHALRPELASYIDSAHTENSWYGRDGRSWFAYLRRLRQQNPTACRFVFALDEFREAGWNFDMMASLSSELPSYVVLGERASVAGWRYPPHTVPVEVARQQGLGEACAVVSKDARRLLQANSAQPQPLPLPLR